MNFDHFPADRHTPVHSVLPVTSDDPIPYRDRLDIDYLAHSHEPQPTTLTAACSPLTLKRMPDGRLIVLYNHAQPTEPEGFFPRTPLVYAVSSNEGRTWGQPVVIDDEPQRQHIYPSICFLDEGILVVYSTHFSNNTFGSTAKQKLIGGGKRCVFKLSV
jgi:hypothetical protein